MDIVVVPVGCSEHSTPLLVLGSFAGAAALAGQAQEIDRALGGQLSSVLRSGDFKGREGDSLLLYPAAEGFPAERVLLVGVGEEGSLDRERLRRAAAKATKEAVRLRLDRFSLTLDHAMRVADRITIEEAARAVAEGLELGGYVFDDFKSGEAGAEPRLKVARVEVLEASEETARAIERGVRTGAALARGENLARTLGNLPGNTATPSYLAERAREIGARFGMRVTILGPAELEEEGMGALLAVARGSEQEPRLIVLEHRRGGGEKPLVLVGKGITFDSGGISIKPAQGMEEMKFDMCGGAAVLGAMHAIGELEVAGDVVGIVPASENLLSGGALKPGDIVRTHLGRTVEVINTDAEGRMILADALSYARRFEPAAIVDAATLTGSCVIALGNQASGALGNDEALVAELCAAGDLVGERLWPLPMFEEYREQLKSDYADLKNSGGRPAGAITAAWFLREFVGDTPWAHLDIAGTAYGEGKLAYQHKGATGVPTRLLVEWVLRRVA
jgi:leucyl aminopeptidase